MKKNFLTTLIAWVFGICVIQAQTIYSDPTPLQLDSENVIVYFNATGTPLAGLSSSDIVYAHTGYNTGWTGAPTWGTNSDKYKLTYVESNLWMLPIGSISEYYNVKAGTQVSTLNFVFRTAGSDKQTGDLFLKVYDEGLQIVLSTNQPTDIVEPYTYVKFTANATSEADITITVNGEVVAQESGVDTLSVEYSITKEGDYTAVATATADGETATSELTVACLSDSVQEDYPGGTPKMGPVKNSDGSVTFCIGAPGKEQVVLMGSWNNFATSANQSMKYQETETGKYFWTTVEGLDPEKMYVYYFLIDGGEYIVGDPYARLVLDPNYDGSLNLKSEEWAGLPEYPVEKLTDKKVPVAVYYGNINNYDWVVEDFERPDKKNLIIYELLFRDFTGTEGKANGNGTVRQAIEKIPYLKTLGVNAVELLPIYEFNGNLSWGYNPNFYFAPDKAYGTPDDYKEFIDLCHQNGMAVILDMVFNQSDGLHPWCQMYQWKSNPFYNSSFGGENGAPHAYSVLNDWNQNNPLVQEQWKDVLEYWMTEYKFDGFRFDLVKGLGANESYKNAGDNATNDYNASRVAEMAYLNSVIQGVYEDGYCINENLAGAKEENEMAEDGELNWANVNEAAREFAMGWDTPSKNDMNRLWAPDDSRNPWSTVSYLESHDEERLAFTQDEWGNTGVKGNVEVSMQRCGSAAVQMLLTPGSHMIWQFSEMGNAQSTKDYNNNTNNTGNKIVNWGLLDEPNHRGLYENYCQLIEIRFNNPQFFGEDANFEIQCGKNNWAKGRTLYSTYENQELLTFINPNITGNLTFNYNFKNKNNEDYQILSQSYLANASFDASAGTVTVPANCFVVIGSADLTPAGIEDIEYNANNSLRAYGGNGEIVVLNSAGIATVYSLDGKVVANVAEGGSVYVSSGLYIVKSGKETVKVLVK